MGVGVLGGIIMFSCCGLVLVGLVLVVTLCFMGVGVFW